MVENGAAYAGRAYQLDRSWHAAPGCRWMQQQQMLLRLRLQLLFPVGQAAVFARAPAVER